MSPFRKRIPTLVGATLLAMGCRIQAEGIWIKAGPVARFGMETSLRGTPGGVRNPNPGGGLPLPDVGPADTFADRLYDDGYVRTDSITADVSGTALLTTGLTTNWGYVDNAQLSGGVLTFVREGGRRWVGSGSTGALVRGDTDFNGYGIDVSAGMPLETKGRVATDLMAGLRVFVNETHTVGGNVLAEVFQVQDVRIVDRYRIPAVQVAGAGAVVPNTPAAPFSGTGGSIAVDELIPNIPTSRTVEVSGAGRIEALHSMEVEVESQLVELRMGPRFAAGVGDGISLALSPVLTVNLLNADLSRTERKILTAGGGSRVVQNTVSHESSTEFLLGAGVDVALRFRLRGHWSLEVAGGYNHVESAEFHVGSSQVEIDPSGFTGGLVLIRTLGEKTSP